MFLFRAKDNNQNYSGNDTVELCLTKSSVVSCDYHAVLFWRSKSLLTLYERKNSNQTHRHASLSKVFGLESRESLIVNKKVMYLCAYGLTRKKRFF